MPDSATTLRQAFDVPDENTTGSPSHCWQDLQVRLEREVATIKWPATMPDLMRSTAKLFDIEIPDILVEAWKKSDEVQSMLEESSRAPEKDFELELADHVVTSEHHPRIEVRVQAKVVKEVAFTLDLQFDLKGGILEIKNGQIDAIRVGTCEVEGTLKYDDLTVAEKELGRIVLPGRMLLSRPKPTAPRL